MGQYHIHAGKSVPIVKGGEGIRMEVKFLKLMIVFSFNLFLLSFRKVKFMLLKLLVVQEKVLFMMIWKYHII